MKQINNQTTSSWARSSQLISPYPTLFALTGDKLGQELNLTGTETKEGLLSHRVSIFTFAVFNFVECVLSDFMTLPRFKY